MHLMGNISNLFIFTWSVFLSAFLHITWLIFLVLGNVQILTFGDSFYFFYFN
ncbi:unnamed protein product [Tenebrio molitor]|nr:unnamed protein product [Tenebrio molitor]